MQDDGVLKKISMGAGIFILGHAFSKLFGIFYKALIARTGVYSYGVLSLGIGIFGFFSMIATMGLDLGVTKYVAYYRQKVDTSRIKGTITSALKLAFGFSIIISIVGFILADKIAIGIFHNPDITIVLRILLLIVPFDAMRKIFISTTKAFQAAQYEVYSKDLIENIVKLAVTVAMILLGVKLIGLSIAFASGIIASFLAASYFMNRLFPIYKTKVISVKQYGELLHYSWPLLFTSLVFTLSLWLDSFLLGYFKDASSVGIFNAAGPIAFMVYFFPQAVMTIFLPIVTDLVAKGDKERLGSIYRTITRWIFVSGLMVVSAILIFNKNLIILIFGEAYIEAYKPLIILALGYFINSCIFSTQRVMMAFDKTKLIFIDTTIAFALNIILAVTLIPKYGMTGAAIATATAFTVLSLITIIQAKLTLKFKIFEKYYVPQAFAVIASAGFVFFLSRYLFGIFFLLGIMLIPIASIIQILLIKGYAHNERELFMSILKRFV